MTFYSLTKITIDDDGRSCFSTVAFSQEVRSGMLLSERINAKNFRLRESQPGYMSDWHVAGDPTFITILSGTLRIKLRSGKYQDFTTGDSFVAADYLENGVNFNPDTHGHSAEVIGDECLKALHIKLSSMTDHRH